MPRKKQDKRRFKPNDDFLDNPEQFTAGQAYFLGWMFADGSINVSKLRVDFLLAEQDRSVLENLKRIIGFDGPVGTLLRPPSSVMGQPIKKHQDRARLTFSSDKIGQQLVSWGFDTSKSVSTGFPKFLPEHLWRHFVLGLYEGDGTFSFCRKTNKAETNLAVNPAMAKDLERLFKEQLSIDVHYAHKRFKNGAVVMRFCGNNSLLKFFSWLYNGNEHRLDRKFAIFRDLVAYKKNCRLKNFEKPLLAKAEAVLNSISHVV